MKTVGSISNRDSMIATFRSEPDYAVQYLVDVLKDGSEAEIVSTMGLVVEAFNGRLAPGITTDVVARVYLGRNLDATSSTLTVETLFKSLGISSSIVEKYRGMPVAA